jgi:hypothetical protein
MTESSAATLVGAMDDTKAVVGLAAAALAAKRGLFVGFPISSLQEHPDRGTGLRSEKTTFSLITGALPCPTL